MRSSTIRIVIAAILMLALASVISWTALDASSDGSSTATTAFSGQDIGAARAALGQAMAEHKARFQKGKSPEVTDAFRAYKAAVDERKAEIYARLKQLDILIAEPASNSALDDPARSPYLHPRPEVSAFVAEYDSHRAELSAITRDFESVSDEVNLTLGLQAAACPPLTTINGTLGSGSQDAPFTTGQQTGRILNGLGNIDCGDSNPCSLNTAVGLRTFDAYAFTNPGATTACVTVDFTMTGCDLATAMQFSARVGSFDPANPCANYVGDGGAGFSGEIDRSFSFNVPAGQTFVVVVNTNSPDGDAGSAAGCAYSLTISGLSCQQPGCPPSTTINGILGSGSQNFPSASGQQTGRILNGLGNVDCGDSNPCSLNTTEGLRTFDAYAFNNPGSTTACVTVNFTMTGCNLGQAMQFSARLGSFDPADPCANYVGDGGAGFSGETDNSFSFNVPAGEVFTIVVNANDVDGSAGSAVGCAYSLTISGIDCSGQPCTIFCPSDITQPNDAGQCGATVNFSPTLSGNCGTVTCSPSSGSFFPVGATTVTCTDSTGPSCSFTVTVQTPPPTINCPANVTALAPPSCNQNAGAVVNFPAPTASDICGSVTTVCSPASGSSFPVGTTTVTCTAAGAGGTSNCSFTVSVFGACLQDDGNAGNVVLFNTSTGEYRFCCGGVVIAAGKGTVTKKGCEFTIQHNTNDRRVLIKSNFATGKGTASIQAPPGTIRCTITDRNILDNSCQCGGV